MAHKTKRKRAGRARKPDAKREPSGRIASDKRARAENLRDVVLKQPHRAKAKHPASDWRGKAYGRLLEDSGYTPGGVSKKALYDAATRFEAAYLAYQSATENRCALAKPSAGFSPVDMARQAERDREAVERWTKVAGALRRADQRMFEATKILCLEHHEETYAPPFWIEWGAIDGLLFLAREVYGLAWQGEDMERRPQT